MKAQKHKSFSDTFQLILCLHCFSSMNFDCFIFIHSQTEVSPLLYPNPMEINMNFYLFRLRGNINFAFQFSVSHFSNWIWWCQILATLIKHEGFPHENFNSVQNALNIYFDGNVSSVEDISLKVKIWWVVIPLKW